MSWLILSAVNKKPIVLAQELHADMLLVDDGAARHFDVLQAYARRVLDEAL